MKPTLPGRRRRLRSLPGIRRLALAALVVLPGCAAISALSDAATPLDAYVLTPASGGPTLAATRASHISVEPPTASGAIDTDRILVKPSALQVQYLPGARWVDPAPALVQSLLVASIQDSGAFRLVGRPSTGPLPDYTLLTELRAFQAEATTAEGPPYRVRVALMLSLLRESDRQVIAGTTLSAERIAESADPLAIVPAFDAATDEVLRQSVTWLLARFGLAS
jgi:cholesterol transport system auxiliary component